MPTEPHPSELPAWRDELGGLSQAEIAALAGISASAWQKWELGQRPLPGWLGDWLRYRLVCREELAALGLTFAEACLVCDALNGTIEHEPASGAWIWATVDDGIRIQGLAEKWHVNGGQLVARIRALSPGGRMALKDAVERFWRRPEVDTAELLHEVGLTREDPAPDLPEWMREGPALDGDEWKGE